MFVRGDSERVAVAGLLSACRVQTRIVSLDTVNWSALNSGELSSVHCSAKSGPNRGVRAQRIG